MPSYTSGIYTLWWDGELEDGDNVYLTEDNRLPFVARVFENEADARVLLNELEKNGHPTVPFFLPIVFPISEKYVLAFEKRGQSLDDILQLADRALFHDGSWITKYYKNFLMDLLTVLRNFLTTEVKVTLGASNIFVRDGRVTVTGFSLKNSNAPNTLDEYKEICKVTEAINLAVGVIEEVANLTQIVNENPGAIGSLDSSPLFWTTGERLNFPSMLWDALGDGSFSLLDKQTNSWPFGGANLFGPGSVIAGHHVLGQWHVAMHAGIFAESRVTDSTSKGLRALVNDPRELQARLVLSFMRKCMGHFRENKAANPGLPCNFDTELATHFEALFPGFIWKLHRVGLGYEATFKTEFVPRQPRLRSLWCSEEELNPY